ncbi:hypothetical protein IH979_00380 [Patescibacteria group bacterium]|nr:hypothetical protein [Patescibacteria group bacterium]
MEDLIQGLVRLGFSQKEAKVYLAALELGRAGANKISRRAKVNRVTTYTILDALSTKGLITSIMEQGDRTYVAEPPHRILTLLHLQQKELEDRRRIADQLMLRLRVFHNLSATKPKIRYIESIEGLRAMQREYEELNEDMIQLVGYDTFFKLHNLNISKEHQRELARRKRKIRSILVTEKQLSFPEELDVEYVTISPSLMNVHGEMTVCGNRLILFSFTEGIIAVEIISKTIADTARAVLELAWKQAQEWGDQIVVKDEGSKTQQAGGELPSA